MDPRDKNLKPSLKYDYYTSSTTPLKFKFHFPSPAPEDCKIKISFYTKKPNRVDLKIDGLLKLATNAKNDGNGGITWKKPDLMEHNPQVDSGG